MPVATQPILETERLILRPFKLEDAKDVQSLAGDERVAKETMNIPYPYNDGVAENWISSLEDKWKNKGSIEFAIVNKADHRFMGGMSFVDINNIEAEIGYWLGVPFWKIGYCTEAARALVAFGRREMFFEKMTGRHLSTNPNSGKVLRKIGLEWVRSEFRKDRYGNDAKFEFYETPIS